VQHVLPKGEVVPVPVLCSVTFGAPDVRLQPGEDRRAFLERARDAVVALRDVSDPQRNSHVLLSKEPPPSQQVGALFVLVFGLLLVASITGFAFSIARVCQTSRTRRTARPMHEAIDGIIPHQLVHDAWFSGSGWMIGDRVALTLFAVLVSFFPCASS